MMATARSAAHTTVLGSHEPLGSPETRITAGFNRAATHGKIVWALEYAILHVHGLALLNAVALMIFVAFALSSGSVDAAADPRNQVPTPPIDHHSAIIGNGLIQLGVNDQGHLNVCCGATSRGGTTVVGLRYLPTNAESTAPGCLCEGWGAADATSGVTGFANVATDGVRNLSLVGFSATTSTANSVVQIGNTLRVTHDFHPARETDNLYEASVTIQNISPATVKPRYRRVMDWDIEPTAFSEYVTINRGTSTALLYSSDGGFATANPLGARTAVLPATVNVSFTDSGPADHGSLFDFGFPDLPAGASLTFSIYYGAAGNEADALKAVSSVGAEVYSLGQPNGGQVSGAPNTFIFAFSGVGGRSVVNPIVYPFRQASPSDPSWIIKVGYNTPLPSDHNCSDPDTCYAHLALDFESESGASATVGLPVIAPSSGTINFMDPSTYSGGEQWSSSEPNCMSIKIDGYDDMHVILCHVKFNKPYAAGEKVTQGQIIGEVGPKDSYSSEPHLHMALYRATNGGATPTSREAVAFAFPFGISGCDYRSSGKTGQYAGARGLPSSCPAYGSVTGSVFANDTSTPLAGAIVDVSSTSAFFSTLTGSDGKYKVTGLLPGTYTVTASPPAGRTLSRATSGVNNVEAGVTVPIPNLVLAGPIPPPAGTTILSRGMGAGGLPVVYWGEPLPLTTRGCIGGTARYEISQGGAIVRSGSMTETPASSGTYAATIAPLRPLHGDAHIAITIVCGDVLTPIVFDIYIDPSGTVKTPGGTPVAGATVTVYRSDSEIGPFEVVPNDSVIMSIANRRNPDTTDAAGHFGWDVIAGFYKVRAEKVGCGPAVESAVLTIPPPVTDLDLRLACPEPPVNVSAALEQVNVTTAYSRAPVAGAPAGVYTIRATFRNAAAVPTTVNLSDLYFQVGTLTNGNVLLNRDGAPASTPAGVGARLSVPGSTLNVTDPSPPELLEPGETFMQELRVGLQSRSSFTILVDVFGRGAPAATDAAGARAGQPRTLLTGALGEFTPPRDGESAASCSPRPEIKVLTTPDGPGRLKVTVSAAGEGNELEHLRFGAARNARIDVDGGPTGAAGNVTYTVPAGRTQVTFTVTRATAGQPMQVPLIVVDGCGEWPTFVGAGPSAP
ncbi:MAG: carboxypeptidase regulatory-like domain-containing protein [Chloroflexi bacterium]|nr:carboxypeptidase regulatory-like domain-containing protein [Chloroflexota bacterium]